jgi:hypothetical protein
VAGRGVDHHPQSSREVKERIELYLYPPVGLYGLLYDELYVYLMDDSMVSMVRWTGRASGDEKCMYSVSHKIRREGTFHRLRYGTILYIYICMCVCVCACIYIICSTHLLVILCIAESCNGR